MVIDYSLCPSPCFVLDENKLRSNLSIINRVQKEAGVEVLLAFKAFAMWGVFPIIKEYIRTASASSLNEVILCFEEMGAKSHTYAVAYEEKDFTEILLKSSHITFNSLNQFLKFGERASGRVSCGIRVNPEWSDVSTHRYNPAHSTSRLGITRKQLPKRLPSGIDGFHLHVLCESDSYSLEQVLIHFEKKFKEFLHQLKWINMGGGHLLTKEGYDLEHLIFTLSNFKKKYGVDIFLEPGSAFVWEAGDLVTRVLDIVQNGDKHTAILDTSFTCHMPDTLEMPYRPTVVGGCVDSSKFPYKYRLGGVSCLAGDFHEEYSFKKPLTQGQIIIFRDMIHYTMVKTTMFNGVRHPSIGIWRDGQFKLIKKFGYDDFKSRLS